MRAVNCRFCDRLLGELREDAQYFRCQNIEIYEKTRIFCRCGRHFSFMPELPPEQITKEQIEVSDSIRHSLAADSKWKTEVRYDKENISKDYES